VGVLADESAELVGLGLLGDGDAAGVEVGLQAGVGPGVDSLVEGLLCGEGSLVGGLGILVAGLRGGGTVSGGSRGRSGRSVVENLGTVLANKSTELLGLRALGNVDTMGIAELLELRLTPGVDELVCQGGVGLLGGSCSASLGLLSLEVGNAGVAADGSNQLVTGGGLRSGDAVGVEPLLEVGLGPGVVEPVARVVGSLANLLSDRVIVLADLSQKSVALARLGNRDAVVIAEGLELAVGPAVKNPVLGAEPGILSLVLRLVPQTLDLVDERVLGSSGAVLGVDALLLEVGVQLLVSQSR